MNDPQVKNPTVAPGIDEAPMAVYPLNSSAKLDQEPNPFEKSFSGATIEDTTKSKDNKLTLPPVAAITSPSPLMPNTSNTSVIGGGILPKEVTNQFTWETLRTGPLSPSMLQGPVNSEDYYAANNNVSARSSFSTTASYPVKVEQTSRSRQSSMNSVSNSTTRKRSVSQTESLESSKSQESDEKRVDGRTKRKTTKSNNAKDTEDDEKRKNFLERNRIAALKCRQRKKQWLNNLQAKVEFLTSDNERLQLQSEALKQEIVNLKTLLLAHKDCPVAQANGFNVNSIQKGMLLTADMMRPSSFQQPNTNTTQPQFQPQSSNTTNTQQPIVTNGSSSVIRF